MQDDGFKSTQIGSIPSKDGIIAELDKLNARMEELIERWGIINAQKEEIVKELEMEKA